MVKKRVKWTDDMVEYLKKVAPNRTNKEIAKDISDKFDLDISAGKTASAKLRYGIKSFEYQGQHRIIFTDEIKGFIRDNVKGRQVSELTVLVNDRFKKQFTEDQIRHHLYDANLRSGIDTRFKSGSESSFWKPIGTEKIDERGRVWVKVGDSEWKFKSHVVWEKEYGEVPKGHFLVHLDRDKTNNSLDNLILVNQSEYGRVISSDGLTDDPTINLSSILNSKIVSKIAKLEESE